MLKKSRSKPVTTNKLEAVYRKVCKKRTIEAVDQSEFVNLCSLIETRGIIRLCGKVDPCLRKIVLVWNQDEVAMFLKDKELLATVLADDECVGTI